ncbi:MAG: hypothetical protein VW644_10915 [Alphaproteobacteria bacterium]
MIRDNIIAAALGGTLLLACGLEPLFAAENGPNYPAEPAAAVAVAEDSANGNGGGSAWSFVW